MLIGVALTAILLATLYGTFFSILRSEERIEGSTDLYLSVGHFTDRFSREIRAATFRRNDPLTHFSGGMKGASSWISFTTVAYPAVREGAPASDLVAVRYLVEEDSAGTAIIRETWDPYRGNPFRVTVLEGIDRFDVEYLTGNNWAGAWDGALEQREPEAVKMSVTLHNGQTLSTIARVRAR